MKLTKPLVALVFTLALLFNTGCQSPEDAAYKATAATVYTVDAAMNGWGDWVRAGKATDQDEQIVRRAYTVYQIAMQTERETVRLYYAGKVGMNDLIATSETTDMARVALLESINQLMR